MIKKDSYILIRYLENDSQEIDYLPQRDPLSQHKQEQITDLADVRKILLRDGHGKYKTNSPIIVAKVVDVYDIELTSRIDKVERE